MEVGGGGGGVGGGGVGGGGVGGGGRGGGGGNGPVGGQGRRGADHDSELVGPFFNLLMDRIRLLEQGQAPPQEVTRVRQKPITLPTPKKEIDGSIKVVSVYHWMKMVCRAVDELHLPRDYVLFQMANDFKLPSEWREVFAGSDDLETAFQRIRQRVPPLQASFPELVASLTNKQPTSGLNPEVIERCGEHLSSISALQALFEQDITRENCLAALASIGQTHELNAMMVHTVRQFDWYKQLPATHPDHRSYLDQLKLHLEEQRQVRQDIEASILCGRTGTSAIATVPSFVVGVSKALGPKKTSHQRSGRQGAKQSQARGPPTKSPAAGSNNSWGATPQNPNNELKKNAQDKNNRMTGLRTCEICKEAASKDLHPPWRCKKLGEIRNGNIAKPKNLCGRCCSWQKQDSPHTQKCSEKTFTDKEGKEKKLSWLCAAHGISHYLLCTRCASGPVHQPKSTPSLVSISSCLTTLTSVTAPLTSSDGLPSVIFMSEVLTVLSKNGEQLPAICFYDTMGGSNFSSQIPEEFNHGEPGAHSSPFNLSTLHGTEEYNLPMVTMKISKKGKWETFDFMVTPLPTMPCVQLTESLLNTCKIHHISPSQYDSIKIKIILGVQESTVFPIPVETHRALLSKHPGISTWQSRMSGKLLLQGRVTPSPVKQAVPREIPSCMAGTTPTASKADDPTTKKMGKAKPRKGSLPPGGPETNLQA